MQSESTASFLPHLRQRFSSIIWSCLDADLTKSAVFHAERYYAMDRTHHESRHLYATSLLRDGQTYSALHIVNGAKDEQCTGCLEIKAKCSIALGRHRVAREIMEETLRDTHYVSTASSSSRLCRAFPEEAALRCRSGKCALKGNLPEKASRSFQDALALNPFLWEAFEGLCSLGAAPDIDEIFPPRPPPLKRLPAEDNSAKFPVATGAGFFTPDTGNGGNLFNRPPPRKLDISQPLPFRMAPPPEPTPSSSNTFPLEDNSYLVSRSQIPSNSLAPPVSRPLSSADEGGPVTKKLKSTTTQPEGMKAKPSKSSLDDKARARPALSFANFFSSSGRRSQQTTSSTRTNTVPGKSNAQPAGTLPATRRSTRLQTGTGPKQLHSKTSLRDRRRPATHTRNLSNTESEKDDGSVPGGEVAYSPSPPAALSPRSEVSPSPSNWTSAQELQAQEDYENEQADYYIYELVRGFGRASKALGMFRVQKCLEELEKLPHTQQNSSFVLAMAARAHYEKQDYASAERAFKTLRKEDPYRQWGMEIYSSLLWHLQRSVELSFLAQELLNINPQSPQAWIAVGNLFSLQKEHEQSMISFRRAAQLDPTFAYAYTLSGHEMLEEDVNKAINFFQLALRADARHYNGWYGLGTCYLKMSKLRLAEYHFRKAAEIYPDNAVLLGCMAMVYDRRGDREGALSMFNEALRCSPSNALVRYRRAKVYIAMRKYKAAVEDLELLRAVTPEESNVVFQLAKAYRLIGNVMKSAQTLAAARDMSPKSVGKIKRLLETVQDEGEERMEEG